MPEVHLGVDDTDGIDGMCTTYIATLIVQALSSEVSRYIDYPNMVRLNPNIPWKTRGNGAVALRFESDDLEKAFEIALAVVQKNSSLSKRTDPAILALSGPVPDEIQSFGEQALHEVLTIDQAMRLVKRHGIYHALLGSGRGVIGALSAIGNRMKGDHTFELIAYRKKKRWGSPRRLGADSVAAMNSAMFPWTYNNIDPETRRILIAPRGPDPVLLGIRGESKDRLVEAVHRLKIQEEVEYAMVFRTNEGTRAHLENRLILNSLKAHTSGQTEGIVLDRPLVSLGGHVFFHIENLSGRVRCAIYEPSGELCMVATSLVKGDLVKVAGGVRKRSSRHPPTINVEELEVLGLSEDTIWTNPCCPSCGKRMKSAGMNKGYRCRSCGVEAPSSAKMSSKKSRVLRLGLHLPPPRSHRHLAKPFQRYGHEKRWEGTTLLKEDFFWKGLPSMAFAELFA